MIGVAFSDYAELIAAVVAAVLGWFSRVFIERRRNNSTAKRPKLPKLP